MLEKVGLNPLLSQALVFMTVKCAENVAHWWLMEHLEQCKDDLVSFPGDTTMLQWNWSEAEVQHGPTWSNVI
jgi:hypothetical protein